VLIAAAQGAAALDLDQAHQAAIDNCVSWQQDTGSKISRDYCTCVQDRVRSTLPDDSYSAMLEFASAYKENRRRDLARMQVDEELALALEPVDSAVTDAEAACRS
jgi:hypothetical protein